MTTYYFADVKVNLCFDHQCLWLEDDHGVRTHNRASGDMISINTIKWVMCFMAYSKWLRHLNILY